MDVLLATGEQVTVSLFSMFLRSQGVPATSLLSHQARIYTDRAYGRARIIGIDTARNAAYVAASIIALSDPKVARALHDQREQARRSIVEPT